MPSSAPVVLVIAQRDDSAADLVVAALLDRGADVVRFDTTEFPSTVSLTAWPADPERPGWLTVRERRVDLAAVRSVYRGHPGRFGFPDGMSGPERKFAGTESTHGLGGVLAAQRWRWMDSPSAVADASYKPRQMRVAAESGLRVPRSLITTDPGQLRAFAGRTGGTDRLVYKVLHSGLVAEQDTVKIVYTSSLTPADLDRPGGDDALRLCPHLFQEWIDKVFDVRLTVVGEQCFAVAVHAHTERARLDWRSAYDDLSYTRCETPEEVRHGVVRYLREFGLRFGAFDFSVDADGWWWWLECNPAGRWGWLVEETGLPIADAIADDLVTS